MKVPISLRKRYRRKRRPYYEAMCYCAAYNFPHRFLSGRCNLITLVEWFWNKGSCGDCMNKVFDDDWRTVYCCILGGAGKPTECPNVKEVLHHFEITIDGERF